MIINKAGNRAYRIIGVDLANSIVEKYYSTKNKAIWKIGDVVFRGTTEQCIDFINRKTRGIK